MLARMFNKFFVFSFKVSDQTGKIPYVIMTKPKGINIKTTSTKLLYENKSICGIL
jgi:hypothetical protein